LSGSAPAGAADQQHLPVGLLSASAIARSSHHFPGFAAGGGATAAGTVHPGSMPMGAEPPTVKKLTLHSRTPSAGGNPFASAGSSAGSGDRFSLPRVGQRSSSTGRAASSRSGGKARKGAGAGAGAGTSAMLSLSGAGSARDIRIAEVRRLLGSYDALRGKS
jgi:hypothetical protein